MDLWSLFDFLMPGFLGTERQVPFLLIVIIFYIVTIIYCNPCLVIVIIGEHDTFGMLGSIVFLLVIKIHVVTIIQLRPLIVFLL